MKNIKIKPIIISTITFAILLIVFFTFITLRQSTARNLNAGNVMGSTGEFLKGDKITGTFKADANGLGIIEINFTTFGRINSDILLFKIKEKNTKDWLYTNTYKVDQFQSGKFFPFGFPPIKNSTNNSYNFEITSLNGKPKDAIAVTEGESQIIATYSYNRKFLLQNPSVFLKVALLHTKELLDNGMFVLFIMLIWFVIIVLQILFVKIKTTKNRKKVFILFIKNNFLLFILVLGIFLRLVLALGPYNLDIVNFAKDAALLMQGKWNVYLYQPAYNYSPIMYYIIGFVGLIPKFTGLPFPFVFRTFLTIIDVCIFFVIMAIAKERKLSPVKTGVLFFLNPVSIILTGFHGQFENISLLFVLVAVWVELAHKRKKKVRLSWIFLTISIVIKHISLYFPISLWRSEGKSIGKTLLLWGLSLAIFFATFLPFLSAKNHIVQQVFKYGGMQGVYGLQYYLNALFGSFHFLGMDVMNWYRYVFIVTILIFALVIRMKDSLRAMLLLSLFFFAFTSGIAAQYFVIPIVFGAFFPSKWFYFYSLIVSLAIIGGLEQQFPFLVTALSVVSWNDIWMFSVLWFGSELIRAIRSKEIIHE